MSLLRANNWKTFWPLVLCLVCLPLLAWKQYEWLGQLSRDEGERLRQALQHDLEQAERRVGMSLLGRMELGDASDLEQPQERARVARSFPLGTVRAEFWDANVCWRWSGKVWEEATVDSCEEGPGPGSALTIGDKEVVLVRSYRPPGEPASRGMRMVTDRANFFSSFVALVMKEEVGEDYRVQLVETKTKRVLFSSDGDLTSIGEADASATLLPMMGRGGGMFGFGGGGGGRPPGPPMGDKKRPREPWGGEKGMGGRTRPGGPPPDMRSSSGEYEFRAAHRTGSLQAKVTRSRIGNLAMSAVVLVLLMVSLVSMWRVTKRTQELAQRQMEFVAGVSHELRTPLAVIYSAGQNLADGVKMDGEKVKRYGRMIADEGKRLSGMVEEILGYARATRSEAAKASWEIRDLDDIVNAAIQATHSEVEKSGCLLESEIADGLLVEGEPAAIEHAVRNLILNATKYARDGAWIGVKCFPEGGNATIEVADRGPGLTPKDRQRIFEPFFRGDASEQSRAHGLGLGLALVKRIAEMHGGSVTVNSEAGAGAKFRLRLPLAKMEA